jgi:hypothetical protein
MVRLNSRVLGFEENGRSRSGEIVGWLRMSADILIGADGVNLPFVRSPARVRLPIRVMPHGD